MLNIKSLSGITLSFLFLFTFISIRSYGQQPKKIKTIIVDAGHGGSDAGAHGEYEGSLRSLEKNITLAISNKLIAELKKQLPGTTILPTRTSDITQSVKEKAQFANDNKGDLFVCIHADAVALKTGSRIKGYRTETYTKTKWIGKGKKKKKIVTRHQREVPIREYFKIPTTRKGTSTLIFTAQRTNEKIKAIENSDMAFETEQNDSSLNINYDSPEWKANALLYTQNYFKKSYKLAAAVQQEIANMGREDLGVWQRQKGIWVLQATQMPAILIETGFIANREDERYLNSEQGQQEIAEAIAKGVKKYKDQVENPQPASVEPSVSTITK
ncbi:MAG: N-acetylmuramoyl-L-alanine amidase [Chitinophagaceae bacterium]|nr:N-acetylmuramoyl-L-alanine amidase [Chitinophagaceae bacterium]